MTRERIRQIESKTLAKLRHPSRAQMLREYLDSPARDCPTRGFPPPPPRDLRRPLPAPPAAGHPGTNCGSGIPLRQNALDPGFHGVLSWPGAPKS